MSFIHPHVRLLAHRTAQFRPATIVFVRGFRSPLATSHGVSHYHSPKFPSPRAMATKRKCDDDKSVVHSPDALRTLLSSAIAKYGSAEVALLHIMNTHDFYISILQQILTGPPILFWFSELIWGWIASLEDRIDVSFSNVQYEDIAPIVGLQPYLYMNDIKTFGLHRSRIPTALFKSIVQDIDVMMVQYGPPTEHDTGEARSRFLSPVSISHFSNHQWTQTFTTQDL